MGKRHRVPPTPHFTPDNPDDRLLRSVIGRREFVRTTSGILVATSLGCESTNPDENGTVHVTITGLLAGASSGGSVIATPVGGGEIFSFNIPPEGEQEKTVRAGSYNVAYTAPNGYALAPGTTVESPITIPPRGLKSVTVALVAVVQAGTVQVNVTGLQAGVPDGGSATLTPTGTGTGGTINVGANGVGTANFSAGGYSLAYTPPSGYAITNGTTPQNVTVSANATLTVNFTVAAQTGTIAVSVSGLNPGSPGGQAMVTPSAGGTGVPINVGANGSGSGTFAPGSYTVQYTAPANHTIASGSNPQAATVTVGQTSTVSWTLTFSAAFPTPDIRNNVSFETDFDGFTNWSSGPPTGVTRDTARAFDGTTAVKKVLPTTSGTDIGSQLVYRCSPGFDRLWGRFYFNVDAAINGILKFNIFFDLAFNVQFGGLYLIGGSIGIFHTPEWNQFTPLVSLNGLTNAWHSLEIDYWRNGDTSKNGQDFPSVAVWLDGNQITSPVGTPPGSASFINGRLNFGTRGSTSKLGYYELLGLINGTPNNTVPGNIWVDKVAISSVGRIGP